MEKHQLAPHVAMLPSPGLGHLISLVELSKLLVSRHGFHVTVLVPTMSEPSKAQELFLQNLPENINYILLPQVTFDDLPPDVKPEVKIVLTVIRSISYIRTELEALASRARVVAYFTDLFGTDTFDVAKEVGIKPYLYFPSTPICLLFLLNLPKLDETTTCEYRDLPEPVKLPGCPPLHGKDFLAPVQDRKDNAYKFLLENTKRFTKAHGIMLNVCKEMDLGAVAGLQAEDSGYPPVFPIGPIIHAAPGCEEDGSGCLKWLDKQPNRSVLFVAFGSGGTVSHDQLNEIAFGLEMSGHRFLWVAKSPNNKTTSGAYFSTQSKEDPLGFLPEGFLERTKDRGLVVASWAPQIKVLQHPATCGFVTHCGWGSILEATLYGVPMIAWPLYAEQPINAVMVTEGWKVALRPNKNEDGLIEREEISTVVKQLMESEEGDRIRERMKKLSDAAKEAWTDNGSSTKALALLAHALTIQQNGVH
ncbi:hypothetical protein Ancab_036873 [Ancistrocladus abbreviatus]